MRPLVLALAVLVLTTASGWAYPATVTAGVNMRTGPGVGHPVIRVLPRGATVDVRRCRGNWCEVSYGNRRGFVSQRFLAQNRPPSRPPLIAPPPIVPPPVGSPPPWVSPGPAGPGSGCNERRAFWAIGEPATPSILERARISAGARTVRVVRPGQAITLEFNPHRLTIELDGDDHIARVNCG